jgi:hypothetical protein
MQFSILALAAALAATASATYTPTNGTVSAVYPTGTGAGAAASSGSSSTPRPTSSAPFEGAASLNAVGSMMGMVVVGGVALVRSIIHPYLRIPSTDVWKPANGVVDALSIQLHRERERHWSDTPVLIVLEGIHGIAAQSISIIGASWDTWFGRKMVE